MNYIVTALKPEAQAFVDKYKLKKSKLAGFSLYENENFTAIISGIGVEKSTLATTTLLNHFKVKDNDIFLNIGICGASKSHNIGDLIEISSINYIDKSFKINQKNGHTLTCLNEAISENKYEIVDMESYGFYKALADKIDNIQIFKVVSDHFEPQKVTKEKTKSLIFKKIEEILKKAQK